MPSPKKFRVAVKILRKYDRRFQVWAERGKGSERIIYHPDIGGSARQIPVKYHGKNTELRKGVISAIIRRFELPDDLFD
jgi:predicted RNA binding protein YcfA (HicA-like mRNA interferase family)